MNEVQRLHAGDAQDKAEMAERRDEAMRRSADAKMAQELDSHSAETGSRRAAISAAPRATRGCRQTIGQAGTRPRVAALGQRRVENLRTQVTYLAANAANAIEDLFGAGAMRVSVDNRRNSLIVLGKQDSLRTIEALLMNLDQKEANERRQASTAAVECRGKTIATASTVLARRWAYGHRRQRPGRGVAGQCSAGNGKAWPDQSRSSSARLLLRSP